MALLCEPEILLSKWQSLFDINFGAPKLNQDVILLAFGTILSIIGVYTKVLNLVRQKSLNVIYY